MPTTIKLQNAMTIESTIVFILFLLIVFYLIYSIKNKKRNKKQEKKPKNESSSIKPIELSVKERYIEQLDGMLKEFKEGKRSERDCYQLLSFFLRAFFKEHAGVDVSRMTLAEIRGINDKKLEKLIQSYYAFEFAPDAEGDIEKAIDRTKKEIENW